MTDCSFPKTKYCGVELASGKLTDDNVTFIVEVTVFHASGAMEGH